jgi:hypothetical protein
VTALRNGARRTTLPRRRPAPEHNIIQNPAITRGIQRLSGVRQAHVAPALMDGLGAQILAGDVREDPRNGVPESYAITIEQAPDNVNVKRMVFCNPLDSDRIAVLRRLHIYTAQDWNMAHDVPGGEVEFVYNLTAQTGFVLNPTRGIRLVDGYQNTVLGGTSPPPMTGLDIQFPPRASRCGFHSPSINGIDGGYIWRGVIGGAADFEIVENFNRDYGPRIIIFPGGTFTSYAITTDFHAHWNMWWDEYPLT